jgi:hypothetical protein
MYREVNLILIVLCYNCFYSFSKCICMNMKKKIVQSRGVKIGPWVNVNVTTFKMQPHWLSNGNIMFSWASVLMAFLLLQNVYIRLVEFPMPRKNKSSLVSKMGLFAGWPHSCVGPLITPPWTYCLDIVPHFCNPKLHFSNSSLSQPLNML